MIKLYLSWQDIDQLIDNIVENYDFSSVKNLYGLPRGGLIPAVLISHKTGIPLLDRKSNISKNTLIIDDICDTGKTLSPYLENLGLRGLVLTGKKQVKNLTVCQIVNKWVVFPWETEQSSKVDYLDNSNQLTLNNLL